MAHSRLAALALGLLVLPASVQSADARTWLERFLSGEMNRPRPERVQPEPEKPAAPKPIKKVSAPSYFQYRAAAPVKVDFAALMAAPVAAAGLALGGGVDFVSARAHLEGFELLAEKADAEALVAHYSAKPEFLWVTGFGPNAKAKVVADILARAGE